MTALHHFYLTADLIAASGHAEVKATITDMRAINIAHLPFPYVMLTFPIVSMLDNVRFYNTPPDEEGTPPCDVTIVVHDAEKGMQVLNPTFWRFSDGLERTYEYEKTHPSLQYAIRMAAFLLIVALATKNTERQTSVNRRAERGIGNGKFRAPEGSGTIYVSTTRLAPPKFESDIAGGWTVRPHLRRGHKHTFLVGPGREEQRIRWVEPVFVNGALSDGPGPVQDYVVRP